MSLLDTPPSYDDSVRRSKSLDPQHRRPKQRKHVADVIDRLDESAIGGYYHHSGPYDATMRSFNLNKEFSPVAATKEGNKAAWMATPREAQLDALRKGRPLDGVGIVPPGHRAMNGQVMQYEEGADLMRDMSPGGGAYKRWPGIQYDPDDLKGKGEPGYTIDNKRKAREAREAAAGVGRRSRSVRHAERGGEYEMVPQHQQQQPQQQRGERDVKGKSVAPVFVRQRSSSVGAVASSSSRPAASHLKEGLLRRFGSLKRK